MKVTHSPAHKTAYDHQCAERLQLGGADVRFANGKLSVKGTKGDDDIQLQRVDENTVKLTVNGEEKTFTGVKKASIDGKAGNDAIDIDPCIGIGLDVRGGKGNDSIQAQSDTFQDRGGGGFADYAKGKHPRVRIAGGKGDDDISSSFDYAKLLGGRGEDSISSSGNDTTIRGNQGNDVIVDHGIRADVHGGRGNDLIVADGLAARIHGGPGNDDILNDDPAARIHGGRGKDRVQDTTGTAKVRSATLVDDL